MGRVRTMIRVGTRDCWTLFDSGAENTYVTRKVARALDVVSLSEQRRTKLGAKTHTIRKTCILKAKVNRKPIEVAGAFVIDEIGMDTRVGKPFDILLGARAMQDWGIELVLKDEKLDLSHYPGEFVEF